jgi:GNAT superfamily N-acetyltransferase
VSGVADVALRDGSRVLIRPLGPDDKAGLAAGFERLSERSRYRRFLSPTPKLTAAQLAYLTEIDHRDHEALVAFDPQTGGGLAVARYVRSPDDPQEAEFAVAVADDWQQRGLGTTLVGYLAARARAEGIVRFTALVHEDNQPVRHMLETLGSVRLRHAGAGAIEVSLDVPDDPLGVGHARLLAGWMRAAARGELSSRL